MLNSLSTIVATPRKWPRPELSLQGLGHRADLDPRGMARGVDLGVAGAQHQVGLAAGQLLQIALERAGILGQVFAGAELARVDVDGDDGQVALGLRRAGPGSDGLRAGGPWSAPARIRRPARRWGSRAARSWAVVSDELEGGRGHGWGWPRYRPGELLPNSSIMAVLTPPD